MIGEDGVRYHGSHLSSIPNNIIPNKYVLMGELLGKTGDSGNAKGTKPHLHFGISWPTNPDMWEIRRGMIYPWKYLDAWKNGKNLSPSNNVFTEQEKYNSKLKSILILNQPEIKTNLITNSESKKISSSKVIKTSFLAYSLGILINKLK